VSGDLVVQGYGVSKERPTTISEADLSSDDETIDWARPQTRKILKGLTRNQRKEIMTLPTDRFGHISREFVAIELTELNKIEPVKKRRITKVLMKFADPEYNSRSIIWSKKHFKEMKQYMLTNPRAITQLELVDINDLNKSSPIVVMRELERKYRKG